MGPITTHVLDTASGKPAANIRIVIDKNVGDSAANELEWECIGETRTNSDGRGPGLLSTEQEVRAYIHMIPCHQRINSFL